MRFRCIGRLQRQDENTQEESYEIQPRHLTYTFFQGVGSAFSTCSFCGGFKYSPVRPGSFGYRRFRFRRRAGKPLHRNGTLIPRQPGGRYRTRGAAYGKLRLDSQPGASGQSHRSPVVALASILPVLAFTGLFSLHTLCGRKP